MKVSPIVLLAGILIVGCQSDAPAPEAAPKTETTSTSPTSEPTGQADSEIKPGMSMADVKKIKGAPKDAKHEHGPQNSEIDLWTYDDQTVKFQDGKVVK